MSKKTRLTNSCVESFYIIHFINFRSPQELYMEYDPAGVAFKPAVPIPKKSTVKKVQVNYSMNPEFDKYVNIIDIDNLFADGHVDFYKACKSNL